ncbi:adenine-specific methyltransferase EcoRI family protein [Dietzia maris]|uniref:Adenine-specific methyltransferase EcoRI family protein n=1 Tax=Dietzia maris TaxID=37915 RepID=A0ABT8H650_9ACTN|nr:adenine-specific methyltransferase EcoRI family protein [Dietzia maris]MDN4507707.1 adenine-specific methyltransferase EcoRI family protein [Dietzia maris]
MQSEIRRRNSKLTRAGNSDFQDAKRAKKDEFYTQLADIEAELQHHARFFRNKVVYLNCDDPRVSNFFRYFSTNFEELGLKKLLATCYKGTGSDSFGRIESGRPVWVEYTGDASNNGTTDPAETDLQELSGNGDFRSPESIALLEQADVVVTNPPFSLFREYVSQLIEHKKKFLILGNMNALTYKEIFPLFQNNQMWYGPSIRSGDREFRVPNDYPLTAAGSRTDSQGNKYVRVKGVRWFTNLDYEDRHKDLDLTQRFDPDKYPRYANFDAIEVGKTADIPADYAGLMGVPITFIDKYNPDQFEIIGSSKTLGRRMSEIAQKGTYQEGGPRFYLPVGQGQYRRMYDRIVVRNRRLVEDRPKQGGSQDVISLSR